MLPIPGTRRISYLESNVGAVGVQLDTEEIAALDQLFDPERVARARYPDAGFVGIESR